MFEENGMNDDCWKVDDTHHLPGREGGFDKPLTCEIPGIPSVFQLIVNVLMLPHTFAPCFKIMIGVKLVAIYKKTTTTKQPQAQTCIFLFGYRFSFSIQRPRIRKKYVGSAFSAVAAPVTAAYLSTPYQE